MIHVQGILNASILVAYIYFVEGSHELLTSQLLNKMI